MDWKAHGYRVGTSQEWFEDGDLPVEADALDAFSKKMRKRIEPWLSAVFQSEHLNLLVGSGFTIAVGHIAGASSTDMSTVGLETKHDLAIRAHAAASAKRMGRGEPNIEDQFRSALALLDGFDVLGGAVVSDRDELSRIGQAAFLTSLLNTAGIANARTTIWSAAAHLQSFH